MRRISLVGRAASYVYRLAMLPGLFEAICARAADLNP
jgi:hypothetical protein